MAACPPPALRSTRSLAICVSAMAPIGVQLSRKARALISLQISMLVCVCLVCCVGLTLKVTCLSYQQRPATVSATVRSHKPQRQAPSLQAMDNEPEPHDAPVQRLQAAYAAREHQLQALHLNSHSSGTLRKTTKTQEIKERSEGASYGNEH